MRVLISVSPSVFYRNRSVCDYLIFCFAVCNADVDTVGRILYLHTLQIEILDIRKS